MSKYGLDATRILYVIAMMAIGAASLHFQDFALGWQPVPAGFPMRPWLASGSGAVLLAGGLGLLLRRPALWAALLLAFYWGAWTLIRTAQALPNLGHTGAWLGIFENLTIACGAVILAGRLAEQTGFAVLADKKVRQWVWRVFAVACLVFGLSHFIYSDFTARMIPAWLPFRLTLAYLTGAGHIAAGIALLSMTLPRLAATLEALMLSSFVLLVHVPSIGAVPPPFWAPSYEAEWFVGLAALAIAASGWTIASSLAGKN